MIMAKLAPLQINLTPATLEALEILGRNLGRLAEALSNTQPKTDAYLGHSVAEAAPYARDSDLATHPLVMGLRAQLADTKAELIRLRRDNATLEALVDGLSVDDDGPTEGQPAAAGEDSAGETHNPQRHHEPTEPLVDSIDAERWAREFITNHAYDIAEEVRDGNADGLMLSLVRRARDELRRERDNARQLLAIIGDERDKLNEQARDLQRQLDAEPQPFLQANAQLREENARLVDAAQSWETHQCAHREQQQRIDQLVEDRDAIEAERDELEQQVTDARRDYEQLGQRTHDLEVEVNRLEVYERTVVSLGKGEHGELVNRILELEQQLDEARRERNKARALTTLLAEERNQLLGDRGIDPGEQQ